MKIALSGNPSMCSICLPRCRAARGVHVRSSTRACARGYPSRVHQGVRWIPAMPLFPFPSPCRCGPPLVPAPVCTPVGSIRACCGCGPTTRQQRSKKLLLRPLLPLSLNWTTLRLWGKKGDPVSPCTSLSTGEWHVANDDDEEGNTP